MSGRQRSRAESGFTLLELLVSMTLLGLIALLLAGGLRFGTRAWETQAERSHAGGELVALQGFLRRQLEQAFQPFQDGDDPRYLFEGTRDGLRFTAPLMARAAPAGLHHLDLRLNDERQLVLSWRPAEPDEGFGSRARPWRREVLLEGAEELGFAYLPAPERRGGVELRDWRDEWRDEPDVPALLRLRVRFATSDARVWPDLLVASRIEVLE